MARKKHRKPANPGPAKIAYDAVSDMMAALPTEAFEKIVFFDHRKLSEGRILAHSAMLELMHFIANCPDPKAPPVRAVVDLVTLLYENGDEECRNLVNVSFFDDLAMLPQDTIERVREMFSGKMQETMDREVTPKQ